MDLTDPAIDALLESPNVRLLRWYRNAAVHFQPALYHAKFVDFMGADGIRWATEPGIEFGRFFHEFFGKRPQV